MTSPKDIPDQLYALIDENKHAEAAALADSVYHLLATRELPMVWEWAICEDLGDFEAKRNPELAIRLYELAKFAYYVMGTDATGSGEGIVAMAEQKRMEKKIAKLRRSL